MTKSEDKEAKKREERGQGKKGGRGTHGSMTKAGKVRQQTVKVDKTVIRKNKHPSTRNRERYIALLYREEEKKERRLQREEM